MWRWKQHAIGMIFCSQKSTWTRGSIGPFKFIYSNTVIYKAVPMFCSSSLWSNFRTQFGFCVQYRLFSSTIQSKSSSKKNKKSWIGSPIAYKQKAEVTQNDSIITAAVISWCRSVVFNVPTSTETTVFTFDWRDLCLRSTCLLSIECRCIKILLCKRRN